MRRRIIFFVLISAFVFVGCSAESSSGSGANNAGASGANNGGAGGTLGVPLAGSTEYSVPLGHTKSGSAGTASTTDITGGADGGDGVSCGSISVNADVQITKQSGNILVVFDRSLTMSTDWNGSPRYLAAGNALIDAITPLQDQLTVGGVFFPSGFLSCTVSDITASDQINFMPAAQFITTLPNQFVAILGLTPIEASIIAANGALSSATLKGNTVVVLMTDGEPDCQDNMDNANSVVAGWAAKGIKTYVVGLPGSAAADAILYQLAQSGGTNNYFSPDDPAALQAQFATIITEITKRGISSCTINLVQTADTDIEKLQMIVMEKGQEYSVQRQMANGGGWTVSADGKVATMTGALCDDAKNGRFDSVRFDFGCVDIPVLK
jgi:hypothetical protein